jgi:hypothetical protein
VTIQAQSHGQDGDEDEIVTPLKASFERSKARGGFQGECGAYENLGHCDSLFPCSFQI